MSNVSMKEQIAEVNQKKLTTYSKWQKEAERWHVPDFGSDPHVRMVAAVMMENQRLMSEQTSAPRCLIEVAGQIIRKVLIHNWVSVQPMLAPVSLIYHPRLYTDYSTEEFQIEHGYEDVEKTAVTRKLKTSFNTEVDYKATDLLMDEANNFVARRSISDDIAMEINYEVLTDLRNNAGTVSALPENASHEAIWAKVGMMRDAIKRKCFRDPNWLVVGQDTYERYKRTIDELKSIYKVHVVPLMPPDMLMGYRGEDWADAPYAWAPYIMLSLTPIVLDPESFCPRRGYIIRYGKYLHRTGAKYLGRIKFTKE